MPKRKAGEPFLLEEVLERRRAIKMLEAVGLPDGVQRCARCGNDHFVQITALPLYRPLVGVRGEVLATHYFFCPTNGQPVMVITTPSAEQPGEERSGMR